MRGLKVFLFITFVIALVYGVIEIFLPAWLAGAKLGPQDAPSARYMGITFLAIALATWYTLRDPVRNIIVVRTLITMMAFFAVLALYHGVTGQESWSIALPGALGHGIIGVGLVLFYPRSE